MQGELASEAGIKVVGFAAYDPKQPNFQATFTKIKSAKPDVIFIGGLVDENSGQLINDKVAILGPNVATPEGRRHALSAGRLHDRRDLRSQAGRHAVGPRARTSASPGVGIDQYKGAALDFINGFKAQLGGEPRSTRTRSSARRPRRSCSTRSPRSDGTRSRRDRREASATKVHARPDQVLH